ncbi:MAG: MEDS domain-containing protein [Rhodospirillaceae bacterium]|nr:MEDS domain-containing protein [Rhodospirillales bacterium]
MIIDYSIIANLSVSDKLGSHTCHFYDSADDLAGCVVPFLVGGIIRRERCIWVVAEPLDATGAHAALSAMVSDLDQRVASGQVEIIDAKDWYGFNGEFNADRVIQGWLRQETEALAAGYAGLRITGNTFWLETPADFASFAAYEERLHTALAGHRITCLCSYCLARCSGGTVLDVVRNHDFAMVRRNGDWEVIESASTKAAKSHLVEQLASKETLLNEIHHRVKNNLQIVSSLLMLKASSFTEPAARQAVEDTQNRIHAMGLIHGMLYREHSGHESIDFAEYLRALAEHLVFAYGEGDRIAIDVEDGSALGEAMVPLDLAVPLGVAMAEAITNAIKHAFPDGRAGLISVSMTRTGEDFVLSIADDGRGITATEMARHGAGAGLSLIRGLVAQAGGTLELSSQPEGGTKLELRLKLLGYPALSSKVSSGAHSLA